LIQPAILTNLIASFPEAWYRERFSRFRIGVSASGRGIVINDADAISPRRTISSLCCAHFSAEVC
jgi:hypothetical protein